MKRFFPTTLVCLFVAATAAKGQVNGDATIAASAPVFGSDLTVSTSSQFAGAVSSIRWGDKEFINNWDHGRQLQVNSQFFNRYCCYNPYEAGSFEDAKGPTSTSKLLSLTVSGNQLETNTQMAWNFRQYNFNPVPADSCGDPAQWLPIPFQPMPTPYTTPLSNYKVHKTITIGFAGAPNVIEYLADETIPEPVLKGTNNITAVLNYEFSSLRSWDVVSRDYRNMRALGGVDDRIKVVSTADGNYAIGWYAPELLQPYGDVGVANWWFIVPPNPFYPDPNDPSKPDPDYACVHFGSVNRYDSFDGPGETHDRAYLIVGNLDQVKEGLAHVHSQFASLDPEVFNWRDYLAINGLGSLTPQAAQDHWLNEGLAQGLSGSRTFSPSQYLQLNPDLGSTLGVTNYAAAIDHFVNIGRAEGRSTTVKPSGGMQHLAVVTNGTATAIGQNVFGQLGDGSNLDRSITEIAVGDYTSLAVKKDSSLWMWGSNQYGARGDASSGDNIITPVQVALPTQITTPSRSGKHAIAVGTGCYAAIDTQGQVWTWGANWNGRLGDGSTVSRYTPARVKKSANPDDYLTGVVSIAIGGGTMAAVDADGAVWTWGAGINGTLGNGLSNDSGYAVQVVEADRNNASTPLLGITEVACGSTGFCIALARYGLVFGWGNNDFGQLGIAPGGALSVATPIAVGPGGIDAIAAGASHSMAHSAVDGRVYGWGYNGGGQLGLGFASVAQVPPAPMNTGPDGMNDISELAAGANFSAMVRYTDRAVFVCGDNQSGQLGIPGNPVVQLLPVKSSVIPRQ